MFARNVTLHLKPNAAAEFTRTVEKDVLPLMRMQVGFKDEITFIEKDGTEAVAISLWEKRENAEAYGREAYPQVLKTLAKVVLGVPEVDVYEVSNSTFHKIAARTQSGAGP